jgi:hypothetical protein
LRYKPKTGSMVICKSCGKPFYAKKYELDNHRKFCSVGCRQQWEQNNKILIKKICVQCGKPYEIPGHINNRGTSKYCSLECKYQSRRLKVKRICRICGKEFYVPHSKAKNGFGIYCSKECDGKAHSRENHPQWNGGSSFHPYCKKFNGKLKNEIRKAFDYHCFICGKVSNNKQLCIHHVDYNKSQGCAGKSWGLIPLCGSCHSKTNYHRYYWFCLLRDYWVYNYIDFNTTFYI